MSDSTSGVIVVHITFTPGIRRTRNMYTFLPLAGTAACMHCVRPRGITLTSALLMLHFRCYVLSPVLRSPQPQHCTSSLTRGMLAHVPPLPRALQRQPCESQVWLGGNLRAQVFDCVRAAIKASTAKAADMRFLVTGKQALPSLPARACCERRQFLMYLCHIRRMSALSCKSEPCSRPGACLRGLPAGCWTFLISNLRASC